MHLIVQKFTTPKKNILKPNNKKLNIYTGISVFPFQTV